MLYYGYNYMVISQKAKKYLKAERVHSVS